MKKYLLRDFILEEWTNDILFKVGYSGPRVRVFWNKKLRTSAGLFYRSGLKRIHLNPELSKGEFIEHLILTLKHEIAHALAYNRAGRRKIKVHGLEWQKACQDLGIPNEKPYHYLTFKNIKVKRKFFYYCPNCQNVVDRVRPFKIEHACIVCCVKNNPHKKIKYDARFQLKLLVNKSLSQ
jgi:SprT protein